MRKIHLKKIKTFFKSVGAAVFKNVGVTGFSKMWAWFKSVGVTKCGRDSKVWT